MRWHRFGPRSSLDLSMTPKFTRPPLARMIKLHEALQAGEHPNCTKYARVFEVSVKTVQRDFEFMRDQLGLPIEYASAKRGYVYTETVSAFPSIQITEGELVAMLVAGKALEQYRGTPYERQLTTAFEKLTAGLQGKVSFTPAAGLAAVSFTSRGQTTTDIAVFETISKAVAQLHEVEFDYRKPRGPGVERRRLHPYHLAYRDNLCYVVGHDVGRRGLRQFALPRMSRATLRKERFVIPPDFSGEAYYSGAFGAQGGTGDYQVVIHFDEFAAFYIRERLWHPTQTLKDLPRGTVELTLRLSDLEEVERWTLSWGDHATVKSPPELVTRLRSTVSRLVDRYPTPKG